MDSMAWYWNLTSVLLQCNAVIPCARFVYDRCQLDCSWSLVRPKHKRLLWFLFFAVVYVKLGVAYMALGLLYQIAQAFLLESFTQNKLRKH